MKKIKGLIIAIFTVLIMSISVYANNITVRLNGTPIEFSQSPVIMNDRVMVPMRGIFESLGYNVEWNPSNKSITAQKSGIVIQLRIGSMLSDINGEKYTLDSPPFLLNGTTMVPVRFISEQSGSTVTWSPEEQTVFISNDYSFSVTEASKAVVQINTNTSQGSGFFIGDGLIATNRHVIKNATDLSVVFSDYSIYDGDVTVVGYDDISDIAILKINKTGNPYFKMGNSDSLTVGSGVTAIGSPLGRLNIVTTGVVTGKMPSLIVSSAKIQQGSSGGVLINSIGEAVGMTFSFDSGNNYFSIPINDIKAVPLNKNLTLEQYKSIEGTYIAPPQLFDVYNENGSINLYWENVYGADGYYVYISNTINGEYTQTKNPNTGDYLWYWGYPKSFGLKNNGNVKLYVKVATVRNGVVSALSEPIEIKYGF